MTNPLAFPNSKYGRDYEPGMTLRDYFAAHVMQGLCASDEFSDENYEILARYSYGQADAMLKEREKWI